MLHTIVVSGQFTPGSGEHLVAEARTRAIKEFGKEVVLGLGGDGDYDTFCVALGKGKWTQTCDSFCDYLTGLGIPFAAVAYGNQESVVILDNIRSTTAADMSAVRIEPGQRDRPSVLAE
jgi:hypothetical protein